MRSKSLMISLALCLCGCTPLIHRPSVSELARVWLERTPTLEAKDVYAGEGVLYLKFRAFDQHSNHSKEFFGYARWETRRGQDLDLYKNPVVPIVFLNEGTWKAAAMNLGTVEVLPEGEWQELRRELARRITPQEEMLGAILHSHGRDLVFYYDSNDQLQIVDLDDKPAKVIKAKELDQRQVSDILVEILLSRMTSKGLNKGRVLMTMPLEEDPFVPFLYIDLEQGAAVNLAVPEEGQRRRQGNLITTGWRSADHVLIDSHVLGVATRPISSSFRLYSWTKNMTRDLLRPRMLQRFESPIVPPLNEGPAMDLEQWEVDLNGITGTAPSTGTMDFLIGGEQFFPRLMDVMELARESIDMRIFIFDNDDFAVKIADTMKRKSTEEDVDVRVLLDGVGVIMGEGRLPASVPEGFKPPASMVKYLQKGSDVKVRVRPNTWFKADHVKTIVVDQDIGFTGGMNIGREYRYDWHDMMIEVRGPILSEIIRDFNIAWAHASPLGDLGYLFSRMKSQKPVVEGEGYPIRLLYTRANDPQILKAQLAAIKRARKYIYIHNAYFSDDTILSELINARRRGVDVRVVLPVNGNHEIMNASNIVTANAMFKNGIRVYFYPGMSHIKAAIYDGWLCTGSANFDKLSLRDNLEMNLATSHPKPVNELKRILFEPDFKRSMEMGEPFQSGLKERLAEFLAEQL